MGAADNVGQILEANVEISLSLGRPGKVPRRVFETLGLDLRVAVFLGVLQVSEAVVCADVVYDELDAGLFDSGQLEQAGGVAESFHGRLFDPEHRGVHEVYEHLEGTHSESGVRECDVVFP